MFDSVDAPISGADATPERCPVIRISIPWMLDVLGALDRLEGSVKPGVVLNDMFVDLYDAHRVIEVLYNESVYKSYLRASLQKANELHGALDEAMNAPDPTKPLQNYFYARIQTAREQFKLVFLSEISTLPVFMVTPKDNYDVALLIERGWGLFPPSMLKKAPETYADAMEAGKAIAFSLPTACGFHTFRVVESVLKRYWDVVTAGDPRPDPETLGKMAADLGNKNKGDIKVIESLKQIAKLHRNPCIHPEVILTEEEAIGTLGIARSVIGAMLAVMPDAPTTTTTVSSSGAQSAP